MAKELSEAGEHMRQMRLAREHRERLRLVTGSRDLTVYSAAGPVWNQPTALQRDRAITVSSQGAEIGDRLTLSRELDRSWYDLLIRDSRGLHLATLTANAFAADLVFEAGSWQLVHWCRHPIPEAAVDVPPEPELVPRMLTPEELSLIAAARAAAWPPEPEAGTALDEATAAE